MRIWVTGIGVVSPLARGAHATMDWLLAGDRAFGDLTLFELPGAKTRIAAEVVGVTTAGIAPRGGEVRWSRTDAMALLAAREALADAALDTRDGKTSLVVGGSTTGMFENELELAEMSRDEARITLLPSVISHPLSSTADRLCEALGPFDQARTLCSACSSGANAILIAATWIRSGRAQRVLAGGADGLCRLTYAGFGALGALAAGSCRPFDVRRSGLNLGEGAAFLALESDASAKARGVAPLAELSGWASMAEAHHITNPEPLGTTAARVMSAALARGGLSPADLDYVNAHGTATPLNDAMETAAIRACLGAETERVAVSSSKGQIGHTLAAAGAIEAAVTVMSIARRALPPTIGLEEIDPACRLEHVLTARSQEVRAAISNSFGFGGAVASLVFTEPSRFAPPAPDRRAVVVTGAASVGPLGVLGARATAEYLEPGAAPLDAPLALVFAEHLDVARARRIDRAGRLITLAAERALVEASIEVGADATTDVGALVGTAFASVDGSTAFLRRMIDKGAAFASPIEFPNLVPSSPVGHASIYLGLRGPMLTTADLGATAESAVLGAIELCEAGEAGAMVAGSLEEATPLVARCIGPMTSGPRGTRSEGGAVVVIEDAERARARGAKVLARVAWSKAWRGDRADPLAAAPSPGERALVLSGRDGARVAAALAGSTWEHVARRSLATRSGDNEGAGGFAIAAAVASIAKGDVDRVLIVGEADDRSVVIMLEATAPSPLEPAFAASDRT